MDSEYGPRLRSRYIYRLADKNKNKSKQKKKRNYDVLVKSIVQKEKMVNKKKETERKYNQQQEE